MSLKTAVLKVVEQMKENLKEFTKDNDAYFRMCLSGHIEKLELVCEATPDESSGSQLDSGRVWGPGLFKADQVRKSLEDRIVKERVELAVKKEENSAPSLLELVGGPGDQCFVEGPPPHLNKPGTKAPYAGCVYVIAADGKAYYSEAETKKVMK